jgi:ankyrin repeat protein
MAKAKRKTLPKDFQDMMKAGDMDQLKAVFDACDLNARGGYGKQVALAFWECPVELARWLVEQGADINAEDHYGNTPLMTWANISHKDIGPLLDLGADVHHGEDGRGTALHKAASSGNAAAVRLLLGKGARADTLNRERETPLVFALRRCSNVQIPGIAAAAELLVAAEPPAEVSKPSLLSKLFGQSARRPPTPPIDVKALITRIGEDFEFHRAAFNPEFLAETEAGLDRLYRLFGVTPVTRRTMHDGRAPIIPVGTTWEAKFEQLWGILIPSSGAAATVQGEVIRIASKLEHELNGNGGVNWDADFPKMADAWLVHVASGTPLPDSDLAVARTNVAAVKRKGGDPVQLAEMAVRWIEANPQPVALPTPGYTR